MKTNTADILDQRSNFKQVFSGLPVEGVGPSLEAEHVSTVMLQHTSQNCHLIGRRTIFTNGESWSLF